MRPDLTPDMNHEQFTNHYYLKSELVAFSHSLGIASSGSKSELAERIARFLSTGEALLPKNIKRKSTITSFSTVIEGKSKIGKDFVCNQRYREYFVYRIGKKFSFNVEFQEYLHTHPDNTLDDAVSEWQNIYEKKRTGKGTSKIAPQFEYNRYIRDFFADNRDLSLQDAIECWKVKKSLPGDNRYNRSDLSTINRQ